MKSFKFNSYLLLLLLPNGIAGFSSPCTTSSHSTALSAAAQSGRRSFITTSIAGFGLVPMVATGQPLVAVADDGEMVDDLAMPSEEEQKAQAVSIVVHEYV